MEINVDVYDIAVARWPMDTEAARALLTNYGRHLVASPVAAAGFCLSGYEKEIDGLPGKFSTTEADLFLARVHGESAGCVAITPRRLPDATDGAEIKRLWVEPQFRGKGIGRGLVLNAIAWAQRQGVASVVLDTVEEAMPEAASLYRSLGFQQTARFNNNPIAGVHFYQLRLR